MASSLYVDPLGVTAFGADLFHGNIFGAAGFGTGRIQPTMLASGRLGSGCKQHCPDENKTENETKALHGKIPLYSHPLYKRVI